MNYGIIRYVLGKIFLTEAVLFIPSLAVGIIYSKADGWKPFFSILVTMGILLLLSAVSHVKKPEMKNMYAREGLVIVALSWFLLSFFGALPFVFNGTLPNFIDAFFETASGFTTTGSTVINNIEEVEHAILFWRSFTHLIGGMGILVFSLALLPKIGSQSVHIMRAEVPGPIFGKLLPRVQGTARILYSIYLSMTAVLILLLTLSKKMDLFDACCHAFGAAGTGGFGIKSNSVAFYDSAYIDIVLGVAMILFGINFNLYFFLLLRRFKPVIKNEELRWYLGIIAAAITGICILVWHRYDSPTRLLRDVFFTVSSIITTTGYTTADFGDWPLAAHVILLIIMFAGAMAGSTGGGLKSSRVAIYVKSAIQEVRQNLNPHRRLPVRFEGKPLEPDMLRSTFSFLAAYSLILIACVFIVSIDTNDFLTSFSAVAATLNNIGPGLGIVGPVSGNYSVLKPVSKITLSIAMIAGRLEIFPVLILFAPKTWKKT
ncbi:MAG: TrkH family potassium uptake protein [Acutalibacteraceae bacterium]|jgi:trk system potassium uptake protein TrkH